VALTLFLIQLIFEERLHHILSGSAEYFIAFSAYLLAGFNVMKGAFGTIKKGRLFDENVLMMIATVGAFAMADVPTRDFHPIRSCPCRAYTSPINADKPVIGVVGLDICDYKQRYLCQR
jgi:cation transport ATPase